MARPFGARRIRALPTRRMRSLTASTATGEYLEQLVGWWALDEASGNALDSHTGGLTLTDNNTVGAAEGGRDLEAGSSEYFNRASGTEFQCGNATAYTWILWIKPESFPDGGDTTHFSHAKNDFSFIDYEVRGDSPTLRVWSAGLGANKVATPSGLMSTGTLYMVACGIDAVGGNVWVSKNAGTRGTTALAGMVPGTGSGQFNLGRYAAGEIRYSDGIMRGCAFWKKALTDDQLAWLYNSGTPRTYAEAAAV